MPTIQAFALCMLSHISCILLSFIFFKKIYPFLYSLIPLLYLHLLIFYFLLDTLYSKTFPWVFELSSWVIEFFKSIFISAWVLSSISLFAESSFQKLTCLHHFIQPYSCVSFLWFVVWCKTLACFKLGQCRSCIPRPKTNVGMWRQHEWAWLQRGSPRRNQYKSPATTAGCG